MAELTLSQIAEKIRNDTHFAGTEKLKTINLNKTFQHGYNSADLITIKGSIKSADFNFKYICFSIITDYKHLPEYDLDLGKIVMNGKPLKNRIFDLTLNNKDTDRYIYDNFTTVEIEIDECEPIGPVGDPGEPGPMGNPLDNIINNLVAKEILDNKDFVENLLKDGLDYTYLYSPLSSAT